MNIIIREAKSEDAAAIAKVNISSWRSTYRGLIADSTLDNMKPENYLAKWKNILATMETSGSFCFVAMNESNDIIGYALCGKNMHEKFPHNAELFAIYLLKKYQGQGIGKKLFLRCIEEFRIRNIPSFLLFVLSSNAGSRKFYESFNPDSTTEEMIIIDNEQYLDTCYGWTDMTKIRM